MLVKDNNLNKTYVSKLISQEFPDIKNVTVLNIHTWHSALPICKPGYFKQVLNFKEKTKKANRRIYYCGDYLENPSIEGALTSAISLAKELLV